MTGTVKSYSAEHGYGFIESEGTDYWFHKVSWVEKEKPEKGMKVKFTGFNSDKGFRASQVRKEK